MHLAVAADHAGFDLKNDIAQFLRGLGHVVEDLGTCQAGQPDDYPDFAAAIGNEVAAGAVERGVLICGSGVGASVAANKIQGIRAAVCHDTYSARQGVEHDDMNILVLGSRIIGTELAHELVRAFVAAKFSGEERHVRRLKKVTALDSRSV